MNQYEDKYSGRKIYYWGWWITTDMETGKRKKWIRGYFNSIMELNDTCGKIYNGRVNVHESKSIDSTHVKAELRDVIAREEGNMDLANRNFYSKTSNVM